MFNLPCPRQSESPTVTVPGRYAMEVLTVTFKLNVTKSIACTNVDVLTVADSSFFMTRWYRAVS